MTDRNMLYKLSAALALISSIALAGPASNEIIVEATPVDGVTVTYMVGIEIVDKAKATIPTMTVEPKDGPLVVDMTNAGDAPEPSHGAIEIKGEHHCLLVYNKACIIMGNRLEIK